jgi:hypothetical protein
MSASQTKPPPTVFISYSHDTKDHKAWVAELGTRLREKGVEVILDQWDTELGDDLPKFMERGVKLSDRVIMICTEPYVRKVDDGKGGAGYEAMIVTSELVRDQGLRKFIPVIRQAGKERSIPVCLGTRKYLDLSSDQDYDEGFGELLETIHKVVSTRKPPLGRNPFLQNELSPERQQEQGLLAQQFSVERTNPPAAYLRAKVLIAAHDLSGMRKLMQSVASGCAESLLVWKATRQSGCPTTTNEQHPEPLWNFIAEGVACYDPLLACLCAAVESGEAGIAGQLGWIDLVLAPKGWERSGSTFWTEFPRTILYSLHTRLGAMLLHNSSGEEAFRLLTTSIRESDYSNETSPIYITRSVMGWQDTLATHCTLGWGFLNHLVAQTKWLNAIWGGEDAQRAALVCYFMLASFLEYCREAGKLIRPFEPNSQQLETPQDYASASDETLRRAYALFIDQRTVLTRVLAKNGMSEVGMRETWPNWIMAINNWFTAVYRRPFRRTELPYSRLPQDLYKDPYKL